MSGFRTDAAEEDCVLVSEAAGHALEEAEGRDAAAGAGHVSEAEAAHGVVWAAVPDNSFWAVPVLQAAAMWLFLV